MKIFTFKKQAKKGFSLIELGIVIAVIVLLLVGIVSSSSLITAAKNVSTLRKLDSVQKAIGEFNIVFQKDGIKLGMGTFQACSNNDKYFKNSTTNFCRAMYCDEVDKTNDKLSAEKACGTQEQSYSYPQVYWATEMLQVTGYIPTSSAKIQVDGLYRATHVKNALLTSVPKLTSNNPSGFAIVRVLDTATTTAAASYAGFGDLKKTGWQNFFSPIDADNVVSIGFTSSNSSYYGVFNAILSNGYLNNATTADGSDAYKYLITLSSGNPSVAALTTSEMQAFDVKYDDGKPGKGKFQGGRIEGSSTKCKDGGGDTAYCYSYYNVHSGNSSNYGGIGTSEVAACFNAGNDATSYQPFSLLTAKDPMAAEYTNSAKEYYKGGSLGTPVEIDKDDKVVRARSKSDKSFGCNIVYVTDHKWNE